MKKKLLEITLYCPKCGKTPPRDEKQSNKNWDVIPAKCPGCKVQLKIEVKYPPKRREIKEIIL